MSGMAPLRGLLFTVLCCSVVIEVCCITVDEFYTFGEGSGDSAVSRNDDGSSEAIILRTEFPFFDQNRRSVYVSTVQSCYLFIIITRLLASCGQDPSRSKKLNGESCTVTLNRYCCKTRKLVQNCQALFSSFFP